MELTVWGSIFTLPRKRASWLLVSIPSPSMRKKFTCISSRFSIISMCTKHFSVFWYPVTSKTLLVLSHTVKNFFQFPVLHQSQEISVYSFRYFVFGNRNEECLFFMYHCCLKSVDSLMGKLCFFMDSLLGSSIKSFSLLLSFFTLAPYLPLHHSGRFHHVCGQILQWQILQLLNFLIGSPAPNWAN